MYSKMNNLKILIGCPTYEGYRYCIDEYLSRIKELLYKNFDLILVDNSRSDEFYSELKSRGINVLKGIYYDDVKKRISESRNLLREKFLEGDYDYFLSLEQDVIPPKDILNRLIRHVKDAVSGVYYKYYGITITSNSKKTGKAIKKGRTLLPLIFKFSDEKDKMEICKLEEVEGEKFFKIRACGLGCVLISKKVLEKIKFRSDPKLDTFDDFLFCSDVIDNGFDIYADTSVKCKHLILKKGNLF